MYSPDKAFKIYNNDYWWSDEYDSIVYGRNFNFNESFFNQFKSLMLDVPRLALNAISNENSPYVNQCGYSKNCYLSYNTDYSESCYYSNTALKSKDCMDILNSDKSELLYDSIDINNCYGLIHSIYCKNSSDLIFCYQCVGCSNCYGSVNLRNKKYYFYNESLSKEEYLERGSMNIN